MEFVELKYNEYRTFEKNCTNINIWQSISMCAYRKKRGWTIFFVGLKENDEIIATCALCAYPVMKKYFLFQALRGYNFDFNNFELLSLFHQHCCDFMKRNNGIHFSMDPYTVYNNRLKNGTISSENSAGVNLVINLKQLGMKHHGFETKIDEAIEEPRYLYILKTEKENEDSIMKNMSQLCKRSIKKAIKPGFEVEQLERNQLHIYKAILDHTAKRKGFSSRPLDYFNAMYDAFSENEQIKFLICSLNIEVYSADIEQELSIERSKEKQILEALTNNPDSTKSINKLEQLRSVIVSLEKRLVDAEKLENQFGKKVILSGAMFLFNQDEVIYLTGGSYEELMYLNGQYRLQWEMICFALANNCRRYNFYGVDGDFDENDGVLSFKQGFGGEIIELVGVFDEILNASVYKTYKALKAIKKVVVHSKEGN